MSQPLRVCPEGSSKQLSAVWPHNSMSSQALGVTDRSYNQVPMTRCSSRLDSITSLNLCMAFEHPALTAVAPPKLVWHTLFTRCLNQPPANGQPANGSPRPPPAALLAASPTASSSRRCLVRLVQLTYAQDLAHENCLEQRGRTGLGACWTMQQRTTSTLQTSKPSCLLRPCRDRWCSQPSDDSC